MKNLRLASLGMLFVVFGFTSCVTKKQFSQVQTELARAKGELRDCNDNLNKYKTDLSTSDVKLKLRQEQIEDLKSQVSDVRKQRDDQVTQVGNLAVLSKSANDNIKETLSQLENKDKYIRLIQAARTKADSINLALAINLKKVLKDGIEDEDVEIKVDKTVVFINLSDKMLYKSGSSDLTLRANEVLSKIAEILQSRPDYEVMVEGYTDNVPISNECMTDNWDLSVKRATSVVRVLQDKYQVDPNRLIAAGRGEYNQLATNDTEAGRAMNRRTRIIILPKLNQFYDLLDPEKAANY